MLKSLGFRLSITNCICKTEMLLFFLKVSTRVQDKTNRHVMLPSTPEVDTQAFAFNFTVLEA